MERRDGKRDEEKGRRDKAEKWDVGQGRDGELGWRAGTERWETRRMEGSRSEKEQVW